MRCGNNGFWKQRKYNVNLIIEKFCINIRTYYFLVNVMQTFTIPVLGLVRRFSKKTGCYTELSDSVRKSYLTFSETWKVVWALGPSQLWGRVCTLKANGNSSFWGRILYFKDVCGTSKTDIYVFPLPHYFSQLSQHFLICSIIS